jgi:two-component system KDP operon response regulator KdpE
MHKSRILIVDDDIGVVKSVRANLKARNWETLVAMDGAEALEVIGREQPDLVILDITMPKMDGFEVCRQVREWSRVPIIMLSARRGVEEKVKCLNMGADDYVTKPFGVNELTARIKAVLRRTSESGIEPTASSFNAGDLFINFVERRVTIGDKEIKLTPTEYNLLQELALGADRVFSHSTLLGKVWGPEYVSEREYLHVFVGRLRKEIEPDPAHPQYIITVPGVGYKFQTAS